MYIVYILYSQSIDKYYIGYTSNLENRVIQHNSGNHKSKFTRKLAHDWLLVYKEEFITKTEAIKREKEIKSRKSRRYIEDLFTKVDNRNSSRFGD